MEIPPNLSDLNLKQLPLTQNAVYWITNTNLSPSYTYIELPRAGNLWVYYQYEDDQPAALIEVWHRGGVPPSAIKPFVEQMIPVGEGDMIVYQLNRPDRDKIRLAYTLT